MSYVNLYDVLVCVQFTEQIPVHSNYFPTKNLAKITENLAKTTDKFIGASLEDCT